MHKTYWLFSPFLLFFMVALACNIPGAGDTDQSVTAVIESAVAQASTLQASTLVAQTSILPIPGTPRAETPTPQANTPLPSETATPSDPLVLRTTLCWVGPGTQYEVVSALKEGERVSLLGKGSIPDWWIVKNPIYRDPCWAQAGDLQLDPGINLEALQVYYPPPTPTYTPTETFTPSPTP
jgi:hypothetical protein